MILTLLTVLYIRAASLLPELIGPAPKQVLAPQTGDINVMILIAVILIAAFMIFIILKNRRR